jgi:hypothetical protein
VLVYSISVKVLELHKPCSYIFSFYFHFYFILYRTWRGMQEEKIEVLKVIHERSKDRKGQKSLP